MKDKQILLSTLAFKKMILHTLRYPSSKVYGVFTSKSSQITNSYPLFHTPITTPTLSLALDLVQSNLQTSEQIVGFYQFCEDASSPTVLTRLCQTNQQLKNMFVIRISCVDKQFRYSADDYRIKAPEFEEVEKDLLEGKHRIIVDIQTHLDCPQLDFRNIYLQ